MIFELTHIITLV